MKLPDAEQWDAAAKEGERVVRNGIEELRPLIVHSPVPIEHAVGLGMLVEAVSFLRSMTASDGRAVIEQYVLAYARGAMRGSDGPLHADGKPFTQALNA